MYPETWCSEKTTRVQALACISGSQNSPQDAVGLDCLLSKCGGLNRNGLHRLMHLNSWSLRSGAI